LANGIEKSIIYPFLKSPLHHTTFRAVLPGDCMPGLYVVFCLLDVAALHGLHDRWDTDWMRVIFGIRVTWPAYSTEPLYNYVTDLSIGPDALLQTLDRKQMVIKILL
jgi:hypothetical protein